MSKQNGIDTAIFTAYEDHKSIDLTEPEKNLMRAILRSAMDDMEKEDDLKRQAKRYFLSNNEEYLYSFETICQQLDLCQKTILELVGLVEKKQR